MSRIWPRSLTGQMLLAVALALLAVQGLGAALIYRAQSERLHGAVLHGLAFRLAVQARGSEAEETASRRRPPRRGPRGFRVETTDRTPLQAGEVRNAGAEAALRRILAEQGVQPDAIVVTYRRVADDPRALAREQRRARVFGSSRDRLNDRLLVSAIRLAGEESWRVARARAPRLQRELLWPLLVQTLIIYIVLVGAVAFIMRRITRPLAALTGRVERFGETRDPDGQIEPHGPDDIRRLIEALNGMENRISDLLDEKDVMLGAIGHDLKTPLTALRVRIESVEDDVERQRMAETIEEIVHSLDDILSLARVGRPSDPLERAELSALVAAVVEEYEDMGETIELGETERIVLQLRSTWLRRALRNLIGNALRYGQRARVSLARGDDRAVIRIDDDGPGIPDDAIDAMMEPFTRGDPSRNTETGGTGLGLALARAIADQHGGALKLANRKTPEGRIAGLTASLELPIT